LLLALAVSLATATGAFARGSAVARNMLEKGVDALRRAEAAWQAEDPAEARRFGAQAERHFRDALAQDPDNRHASLLGGQAAAFTGDARRANAWLERLRQQSRLKDGDPDVNYLAAFIHLVAARRPDRAIRALRRMHSLNPSWRARERDNLWYLALHHSGRLLMEADKYEEAKRRFEEGARLARSMGNRRRELAMLGNIGIALRRAQRYIEAGELFEKLIAAEPEVAVWHWHQALNFATQSRFAEAVPHYRVVIEHLEAGRVAPRARKELRRAYLRLGNCLRVTAQQPQNAAQKGKLLAEAERLLRHYVTVAPEDALGHKWLGVFLLEHPEDPRPYEALPLFHTAFELDEVCEDALGYVIRIHERQPPPPGTTLEAWQAPIAGWRRQIEEERDRREKIRDERVKKTGDTGCD
jgi:tetratricopeptide (TPR) repeat protein